MALTVVTYGGGEILKNIFDAIAMLMNNKTGSLFQPLLVLSGSIGALWATSKAFFAQSAEGYIGKYLLPLTAISGLLMVPTTTVHIEDVLQVKSYKIDHVPFLLARFSELISSLGYKITTAVETVMHTPNDTNYSSTGMIFGGESSIGFTQYKLTNAVLQQNLRRFAKQCVLYDIALGLYDTNELKRSTNLWKLFEEKTSKTRMIQYCPPDEKESLKKCSYCSCKDAVIKMAPFFEKEKKYYAQHDILKNLPLTFQALTGLKQEKEEIIGQQLVMNLLSDEYSATNFAKGRAREQQKSTYVVGGSLAASSLVTIRCVLEAILYATFIFIIPMSILPGGFRFLSTWAWLLVWIQMWPPLFAILSYIMQISAQSQSKTIFCGLVGSQLGLSFFSSSGLTALQQDIYALAGYLSLSVPAISYAIMKGGEHSIISLAGSLVSPAQSAGSAAATELATGNYSFASTSFGQTHFQNSSAFQKNFAPSMASGFMTENTGRSSIVYGSNQAILKQANSDLRTSILTDESMNQSMQESHQRALSNAQGAQRNHMESVASHARSFADLTQHIAKSENFQDSTSIKDGYDVHESAKNVQSVSHTWGAQYGFNQRESMEILGAMGASAGGGVDLSVVKFGGSIESKLSSNKNASRDDILTSAQNVAKSADFQKNMQQIEGAVKSENLSFNDDEGARLAFGLSQALDKATSSQVSSQAAFNELNQINRTAAWAKSNSTSVKTAYNQEFMDWAAEQYGGNGGAKYIDDIFSRSDVNAKQEKASMIMGFLNHMQNSGNDPSYFASSEGKYESVPEDWSERNTPSIKQEFYDAKIREVIPEEEKKKIEAFAAKTSAEHNLYQGTVRKDGNPVEEKYLDIRERVTTGIAQVKQDIFNEEKRITGEYEQRKNSNVQEQLAKDTKWVGPAIGLAPRAGWNGNFRSTSKPFSLLAQEKEKNSQG